MKETDLPFGNVILRRPEDEQCDPLQQAGVSALEYLAQQALERIREGLTASELNRVKSDAVLQASVNELIRQVVDENNRERVSAGLSPLVNRRQTTIAAWVERIFNHLYGLGALEALMSDDRIEDIAVNGPTEVMLRTFYGWEDAKVELGSDAAQLLWRINQVIAFSGKQAGPLMPVVDVQLPGGHRLNIVTEPLTDPWPVIVIRRHRATSWSLQDFLDQPVMQRKQQVVMDIPDYAKIAVDGALLTAEAATYLHMAVVSGLNILVLGRTGVGKTTFLSALGRLIPEDRRVLVLEDTRELRLRGVGAKPANCVYFITRQKMLEGGVEVNMRQLIITALRQRPDHLILGEARGAEIYDLLNAMQTGHGGNLTSIHANSLADLGQRVNAMLYQAGVDMNAERSARLIGTSFHIGVTLLQDFSGRRYVAEIGEFTGGVEAGLPQMQQVFQGGRECGFTLQRLADHSVHEKYLQRSGLSFTQVFQKGGEKP